MDRFIYYKIQFLIGFWGSVLLTIGTAAAQPQKLYLDALDPDAWAGLVLIDAESNQAAAVRFRTFGFEGDKLVFLDTLAHFHRHVKRVGTKTADGSYAELEFTTPITEDTWLLKWHKAGNEQARGTLTLTQKAPHITARGVVVECYAPWDYANSFVIDGTTGNTTIAANKMPFRVSLAPADTTALNPAQQNALNQTLAKLEQSGKKQAVLAKAFVTNHLRFAVGRAAVLPDAQSIETQLQAAHKDALAKRITLTGAYQDAPAAIADNLNWMVSHIPHITIPYIPAGRTWAWGGWTVFEWDGFFNALLVGVHDPELALNELRALYHIQLPNGNIPNYMGGGGGSPDRSQPPVGAFTVWKLYQKTRDRRFLTLSWEPLRRWYGWWTAPAKNGKPRRDQNEDGLLEWGTDSTENLKFAMYESGMDDSPHFDAAKIPKKSWSMNLNALDLNSLRALDAEHLALIAGELELKEEQKYFTREYERISTLVNEKLWDSESGFYYDRYHDGKRGVTKSAISFYPLLAGIANERQAHRMLQRLLDESQFWGQYVIPTVSKDDPSYQDQQYWRGTVWPPTNYLVYQGLKRYGYDSVASVFAERSAKLFLDNYRKTGSCQENYNSITGEGGGQRFQSWGPLLALPVIEELADYESWGGLRLGSFTTTRQKIDNVILGGKSWRVETKPDGLVVSNGNEALLATNVPCVLRNVVIGSTDFRAQVHAANAGILVWKGKAARLDKGVNVVELSK